jgi:hypothetical protein
MCSPAGQEEFFMEVGVPVATRTTAPPKLDKVGQAAFVAKAEALAPIDSNPGTDSDPQLDEVVEVMRATSLLICAKRPGGYRGDRYKPQTHGLRERSGAGIPDVFRRTELRGGSWQAKESLGGRSVFVVLPSGLVEQNEPRGAGVRARPISSGCRPAALSLCGIPGKARGTFLADCRMVTDRGRMSAPGRTGYRVPRTGL